MLDKSLADSENHVLLAKFGLSRALVLQWTAVSTIGFLVALAGFLAVYAVATGDLAGTELTLGLGADDVWWWNLALSLLAFVALMVAVIVPHEFCHGAAIRAFGGQPRYGLGIAYAIFPYAFATTKTQFSRNQFLVIALAPFVVLSLIGIPLMILFEWPWMAVPLALNAGGAVGDIWMALILLSYPAEVSVLDSETGLEVYGPPGLERWENSPATVVWDILVGFAGGVVIVAVVVGILVPLVLATFGVEALTVGLPDSPLIVFEFAQTPDGGFEFTAGAGIFLIGAGIGLLYAYLRTRERR